MAVTPYDHLLDSASTLDDEALGDFIADLQLMLSERPGEGSPSTDEEKPRWATLKVGDVVWWDDPDEGACSGWRKITFVDPHSEAVHGECQAGGVTEMLRDEIDNTEGVRLDFPGGEE